MYFFDVNPAFHNHTLFVTDQGETVTYHNWYEHAAALRSLMRPRSLAFILCSNTVGSAMAYLSCLQNRIVPLLLDNQISEELLDNLITLYKPSYLFQTKETPAKKGTFSVSSMYDYTLYQFSDTSFFPLYDELALLLTTSGSTGSPKLVRQSYANIHSNAVSIAEYLELSSSDRPITSLPMYYTFGLSVINSHVLCGAAIYLTNQTIFDEAFWQFCQNQSITSLAGVPFTYECLKKLRFTRMDLPNLTLMLQAGGKLSKTLHQEYAQFAKEKNKRFIVMYGQTEATARMSYLPASYSLDKIGSIGIAIPGGSFHIMENKNTEITTPLQNGELCYDGPNVTLGYAHTGDDLIHGDEWHGRLWTGDIAYRDEDGFYYIAGRKKRFIKLQGKRISLDEVEQLFKNVFVNNDFACVGTDDQLFIFTTTPENSFPFLSTFLEERTGLHPLLFTFRYLKNIPKSPTGKILYKDLQELMEQEV